MCFQTSAPLQLFTLSLTVLLWCRMWQMVTYLNKDLPRLCRMQPEHLTEAEATSLSSFLKFARSIKELRLSKGDAAAAEELETWHDDIMPTGSVPANVRLDTAPAAGSKGPRPIAGARAGARSSKPKARSP